MNKDSYTIQELSLSVGDGHVLYVHDWGNKNAPIAVISLHGGPGSGSKDKHKLQFNPKKQHVIFFDQRGCGKSTPYGSLEDNTTDTLVSDISMIADALQIKTFMLSGTSWGSTLALAYAVANPGRVSALVIGGVFTGTKSEIEWLDKGKMKTFWPDVWQKYLERTPDENRSDPSAYHFEKALHGTDEEQKAAGFAYSGLEGGVMSFDDSPSRNDYEIFDPSAIRIEMFYLANNCFMPNHYIFDNCDKLTMPVYIVQGRYDMVCPPETAYALHSKLVNSTFYWTQSNHAVQHEGTNIFRSIFASLI